MLSRRRVHHCLKRARASPVTLPGLLLPTWCVVVGRRGGLEQAEQFEHDYDNNDYSNYVEDVSVHDRD